MLMGHCHLFPGGFGQSKRDALGVPGTAEHLVRFLAACGFDQAQILAPVEDPASPSVTSRIENADGLDWLLGQPSVGIDAASKLLPAATINPSRKSAVDKLHRAISRGVRMLKFHPIIMRSNPLDQACQGFFAEAAHAGMPIVYHTGGGDWGWTADAARISVCAELAARHPRLPILMAHCGVFGQSDEFDAAVAACAVHPNLFLDTTFALLAVGRERWQKALGALGAARVVYGTDYPWISPAKVAEELAFIDSLGVPPAGRDLILGGNLLSLQQAACA